MTPDHGPLLYEGKAKRVFAADQPDRVLVEFKNDATAFNALKRAELEGKGRLNCQISARLFEMLEREGVPTHYLGLAAETWMLVQHVDVIPLEVVIRNVATGSLCQQTPIAAGTELSPALLDLYYTPFPSMGSCMHHCQNLGSRVPSDKRLNTYSLWLSIVQQEGAWVAGPSGMRNFIPVRYNTVFLQNPGIPVFFGTVSYS